MSRGGTLVAVYRPEVTAMKVAIPVFRERVSPVFDTAAHLRVLEFDGPRETSRYHLEIKSGSLPGRVDVLSTNGVDVLLCGAVSRPLFDMLELAGIRVEPFLSGTVDSVLRAYAEDRLSDPRFRMPGCCERRRRRAGRRGGRRARARGERGNS